LFAYIGGEICLINRVDTGRL